MPKPKLEVTIISETRDCFGVWEVTVAVNKKIYTYPIDAEFGLKKVRKMIRLKKYGKALHLLSLYKLKGFNSFEEDKSGCRI